MSVYHDLGAMIEVAKHNAKEHDCNYNVILSNPVDGEFGVGSTYEFVTDSYFDKERNCILLHKTDDLLQILEDVNQFDTSGMDFIEDMGFSEEMPTGNAYDELMKFTQYRRQDPYVRKEAKVSRNEPCTCGSELKYKKCCGKKHFVVTKGV